MKNDTKQAMDKLLAGGHTCVLCKGNLMLTDDRRGVRPLLELLGQDLRSFCAADKVVGKAAAMLYCLIGVSEVYARIISEPALAVLKAEGIGVFYDQIVPAIRNRTGTGFCPMEAAVWDLADPQAAPEILRNALEKLNNNPGSI